MPAYSNIRTFVEALRTGKTNTTHGLERLFTNPGRHRTHPHFNDLNTSGALNRPLPGWAKDALRAEGLSPPEVHHIDMRWPDDQKELVRQKLVDAIQGNRQVQFFWELYGGHTPVNEIQDPDATGGITITFRSPRLGVRVSAITHGSISVEA